MKPMLSMLPPKGVNPDVYLDNGKYLVQQKLDGERLLVQIGGGKAVGFNRKGAQVPSSDIPAFFHTKTDSGVIFDGEIVGETYYVFDIFMDMGLPFSQRAKVLSIWDSGDPHVRVVATPKPDQTQAEFVDEIRDHGGEGVILKLKTGLYRPGKRTLESIKYKFVQTCDVIVTELNRDGSELGVSTATIHDGALVDAGGCKVPPEALPLLKVGSVIEVRYLYAMPSHRLYQPVWVKLRTDKDYSECTTDQLKYTNKSDLSSISG